MIPRYSRPEIASVWEPESKFAKWLEIEILAAEAWSKKGLVPPEAIQTIRKKAKFDIVRIDAIEAEVKHDVIAFLTNVAENIGPEARYLHIGLTSSDIVDTCFSLQLKEASSLLKKDLEALLGVIRKRALDHKMTPMIGRTHGIHAEPITFGLKLIGWYEEMKRALTRLDLAEGEIGYGKLSGAVGTYANGDPFVEKYVCEKLGLRPEPVATQVIPRDRYAVFFCRLAITASSIERIATELRHLQRTELLEAEEAFTKGQKGSSAMPHKRNPVSAENLCGLARLVRSYAMAAMENVALWHERDISHSSVERVIGPDATILMDYMLVRLTKLIEGLVVYPENMKKNLEKMGGLVYSESVLLELVRAGLTREKAYELVQRNAMRVWEKGADFQRELLQDKEVARHLKPEVIKKAFNLKHHLREVDFIFRRVFEK
ncbi:MAG: adenylosuccinate lyase [Deltaproteobacteria bacterium]|nr:adenylosuccinate lyase [Deltaproteobacteria bacterium]